MSILIKELEMPKDKALSLIIYPDGDITVNLKATPYKAVEISTPHGRLIDADKLRQKMIEDADLYFELNIRHGYHDCELLVDDASTVIEAEE